MHIRRHIFVLIVLAASLAAQQKYPIVELSTTGSERFKPEQIFRAAQLQVDKDKEVPLEEVRAAAERLVNSGVFKEISYSHVAVPGGMRVTFALKDKTNAETIELIPAEFENLVWLSDATIVAEMQKRVPLFDGRVPVIGTVTEEVSEALVEMLAEMDVQANVSAIHRMKDENPVAAVFSTDNVEIRIAKVEFSGASNQALFELNPAARPLVNSEYGRKKVDNFGQNQLLNVYRKAGFLKAIIGSPEIKVLENKADLTTVSITYPVAEGVPYKFMGMRFMGNTAIGRDRLEELVRIKPRDFADGVELDRTFDRVRAEYARSGYMRMSLKAQPQFDDATRTATFNVNITEGTLYTMGEVEVVNLSKQEEQKVRQAWKMREGDPFDVTYLRRFFGEDALAGRRFVIEQSEGEQPNSIDVSLIFCPKGEECKPRNPDALYVPPAETQERQ